MKKKERKIKEGISLIVLVITIIVIIILAAAVIITLNKNNPIEEANRARIESDVANMQAVFTNTVAKVMAQKQSTIEVEEGEINTVKSGVSKTTGQVKYTINNSIDGSIEGSIIFGTEKSSGTTYYTGKELPIYGAGETTWYVDKEGIISLRVGEKEYGKGEQVEKPAEPVEEEKAKEGEIVKDVAKEYIDKDGDKAIIPIDFAIVPGKTDISNGLVISDEENDVNDTGNQFVWIPVDNINNFKRQVGYSNGQIQSSTTLVGIDFFKCEEPYSKASNTEKQEYENMINSVKEYKGFYIGRYEISQNAETGKPQSKKNKTPWVNIAWSDSMTSLESGMVMKARSMYPDGEELTKGNVVSTLIYGTAWDEVIRFLKTNDKYKNIDKDSRGFGNLGINCNSYGYDTTNTVIATGSNEKYSLNNIYDFVGNVNEWTMEVYDGTMRHWRGSNYESDGYYHPVSRRGGDVPTRADNGVGGRIQLYIK